MSVADSALGIEIGTHYIKVVRLAHRPRGVRLLSADILRLPKDRANLVEVVHRFFESKDLLSHPCALCTPMFFSMLHTIEVPEDDPRTEEEIVLVERERLDDISEEEMVYDSISLPTDSTHRTILMAMARDAAVQRLLHVPDSIGLNVTRIVPAAVAIFNASLPADLGHSDAIMCAHIGQTVTHVAIGTRHGILFARHFDIGGARFTASLAEGMGISTREAEDIKIRYGFSVGEEKADPTATTALEEIADAWMAELMSTLEFYRERFPDKEAPMRLVLSGGGAELQGFAAYVDSNVDLEVQPFAPFWSGGAPDHGSRFVLAAGLALAALTETSMPLNLLPPERKNAYTLKAQLPYWRTIGVALSLIVLVGITGRFLHYMDRRAHLDLVQADSVSLNAMGVELQRIEKANDRLVDRLRFAHMGMRKGMILRAIIGEIAHVMHSEDWLILVADSASYFGRGELQNEWEVSPTEAEEDGSSQSLDGIIIEGYTPHEDFATVKVMIDQLQQIPYVDEVDLLTDDKVIHDPLREEEWKNVQARLFAVEIKVQ